MWMVMTALLPRRRKERMPMLMAVTSKRRTQTTAPSVSFG